MGFQGQLSSVQLADLFQTFYMNRQTGTLTVTDAHGAIHIYFDQGLIALCTAPLIDGLPYLITTVVRKGLLSAERGQEIANRLHAGGQPLRQLLLSIGGISEQDLDELAIWCIEELVCPLFELPDGDFTFTDGEPIDELMASDVIELGTTRVQTPQVILEATRRKDEWRRIREIIPDSDALFVVDNDGRANLRTIQTDPEMLKILRYLDGRHTLDAIAGAVGATRFDTYAVVAQMVLSGVARPQSPQDVVTDAMTLKEQGELAKARELLEHALTQARLPEVMRPLAEVCAQLGQAARAVELYLELIQAGQDQGDLAQALQDLDTVIDLSPDDPELHFERAQVCAELGHTDDAAAGYVVAAQAFIGTKDVPRALDACHRAKNLLPRSPDPHRYLARAYLMEGQTENAVVEYKSLWHALLTAHRPRRALDELKTILDADCKFAAIKEQVLSHAQNSEAVKTSKAMRALVYVVAAVVLVAAGVVGWEYYNAVFLRGQGRSDVAKIEATLPRRLQAAEHRDVLEAIERLRGRYDTDPELRPAIDALAQRVSADFEARAKTLLARGDGLLAAGDFAGAQSVFQDLAVQFAGAPSAAQSPARLEEVRQARIASVVKADLADANRQWQGLDWDAALATLDRIIARRDLPNVLRTQLVLQQAEWNAANRSAQALGERAAKIERGGDQRQAITAYRRATQGDGQQYQTIAADRLRQLELSYAQAVGRQLQDLAAKGDEAKAFAAYDELVRVANESSGENVKGWLQAFDVPYALQVDHPGTLLSIRRGDGEQTVHAPAGATGPWTWRTSYHPGESLLVTAGRTGFTSQTGTIAVSNRRCLGTVQLARGPRWRAELTGPATTPPVLANGVVLVGTGKATLEAVDPRQGASRAIAFSDTVAEFRSPPVVFQNRAYVVIEETLHAIDLPTRSRLWSWPAHLTGSLYIQEHDLIQGTLLVIGGSSRTGVTVAGADAAGRVGAYPFKVEGELTGLPGADHAGNRTILYLPIGSELVVADATAATEQAGPQTLYTLHARADLVGRPTKAVVGPAKRPAMLCPDVSGLVIAVDTDLQVPDTKRVVGSWPVDGTNPSTPVIDGRTAYVTTAEGRLHALDLDVPGQLRWKFPATGSLGASPGEAAAGLRGIYVVGTNGILLCLDRTTGRERWHCDLGAPAIGGIAAAGGMVFVSLRSGQLLGFDEGDD